MHGFRARSTATFRMHWKQLHMGRGAPMAYRSAPGRCQILHRRISPALQARPAYYAPNRCVRSCMKKGRARPRTRNSQAHADADVAVAQVRCAQPRMWFSMRAKVS